MQITCHTKYNIDVMGAVVVVDSQIVYLVVSSMLSCIMKYLVRRGECVHFVHSMHLGFRSAASGMVIEVLVKDN